MTATEYEQQAHRTLAKSTAENIAYLGFGLMAEAGEVADKIAKADRNTVSRYIRSDVFLEFVGAHA